MDESYCRCLRPPQTILDLGSNIGMSIILFKSLWSAAEIVGVEASPDSFSILKKNVSPLQKVTIINAAVCDRYGEIPFYSSSPHSLSGSTNVGRGGGEAVMVKAIPASALIESSVDLMKMDIEGSECDALLDLERTGKILLIRQMVIEYHHHIPGRRNNLAEFLERLSRCGFDFVIEAVAPSEVDEFQDILIIATRDT